MTKKKSARTIKKSTQLEKIRAINNHKLNIKSKLIEKESIEKYLKAQDFTKSPRLLFSIEQLQSLYNQINGYNLALIRESEIGKLKIELSETEKRIKKDMDTDQVDKRVYIYYLKLKLKKGELKLIKDYNEKAQWNIDPRSYIRTKELEIIKNEIEAEETFISLIIQIPKLKIEMHEIERKMRNPNAQRSRNLPIPERPKG